jgi:hypothetical protein
MRKLFVLAVGVVMAGGLLLAQTHSNATERKTSIEMTLSTDLRVGNTVLKADEYIVSCDREQVTFTRKRDRKKMVVVECKGTELAKRSEDTRTGTTVDSSGVRVLQTLIMAGSNIEHTFN